jgi:DNA helicase TIP49 (TBP-interacting protein)
MPTITVHGRELTVKQGDLVSIDGATGSVILVCAAGRAEMSHEFVTFLDWADDSSA